MVHDGSLSVFQLVHDLVVLLLLLSQLFDFLGCLLEGLHDLLVGLFLVHTLLLLSGVFFLCVSQFILEHLDDVQVRVGDLLVVVFDIIVLLGMLLSELLDGLVLFILDLLDKTLALPLHVLPDEEHFVLVLALNLVSDSLVLLPHLSSLFVLFTGESVEIFLVADFLLLFGDL